MNICQKNCGTMVNLLHQQSHRYTMYVNGLVPTYSLQSCRRVIILYLLCITERILVILPLSLLEDDNELHIVIFLVNPEATSQSTYNDLAILYLLLHYRKILHLIDDITIILARDDK
jgi:hypothetical protein